MVPKQGVLNENMNTNNKTPTSNSKPVFKSNASNPFARAIQEIGGTTIKQAAAIPGQMMEDALSAIFGSNSGPQANNANETNQSPFASALENLTTSKTENSPELETQKALTHQEMQLTEVFNLRESKDKEMIKQLQEQLRALAREMKTLDNSVKTSISQDVVDPGTYHVHFFQQLLNFVFLLRKRVQEANTWIENFNNRSKKQGAFWNQVYSKKGGTAYFLSQEHQVSRNAG